MIFLKVVLAISDSNSTRGKYGIGPYVIYDVVPMQVNVATTDHLRMRHMANQIAQFPITLCDLQMSLSYCKPFKMGFFVKLCSSLQNFN